MTTLVITIHVIVCFALIVIVLIQGGKGADMGAAFGGASKTVFGPRGAAGPLQKITIGAAVLFMLTCLYLSRASRRQEEQGPVNRPLPTAPQVPGPATQPGPAAPTEGKIPVPAGAHPGKPTSMPMTIPGGLKTPASPPAPAAPLAPVTPAPGKTPPKTP